MLITNLHATPPGARDAGDERPLATPGREELPIQTPDGYGDFACGHCETILLRGEIDVPNDEGRVVAPDHLQEGGQLVRCPECGWDNAMPTG